MAETRPTPGVGAVIVEEGRLLLIRRGRGAYRDYWAIPGGRQRRGPYIDTGDPVTAASQRNGVATRCGPNFQD